MIFDIRYDMVILYICLKTTIPMNCAATQQQLCLTDLAD